MKLPFLVTILLLASCSIGQRPEVDVYTLKPEPTSAVSASSACHSKLTLQVSDPNAAAGIDTQRIAVVNGQNKLDYYNNVRWSASTSEMFAGILVDSFTHAKVFGNVNSEVDSLSSDLTLITDIRDFEVDNQTTGEVRFRLIAKLIDTKTRQILTTIEIDKKLAPSGNSMDPIISAFNQISLDVANDIIEKVKTEPKICDIIKPPTKAQKTKIKVGV